MRKLHLGRGRDGKALFHKVDQLTTHGVIVGMTGSGKTGLGIGLIEEALLNQVNTLVLDPKGDMGNLALIFPEFDAADFKPWVNESTARDRGITKAELAAEVAEQWKAGLADHGIDAAKLRQLRNSVQVTIYTPGSHMGTAINVLGSLEPPALSWETDAEIIREEIAAIVTSIFTLAGVKGNPVQSPEHILVATLIEHHWRRGRKLNLEKIVTAIPQPPFDKLGAFFVDDVLSPRKRQELALRLNNLLASPGFAVWREGVPLDVEELIGSGDKTKCAILYLNHLSDDERQSFVSFLLAKVIAWMRTKEGTTHLNTLIYLDEAFGYLPPVGNPPTKNPIMTILKQARAFGVGMVISTQNPMDMDYRAMSNAGTWLIGRLNTANDKRRVLEGLKGADGAINIKQIDRAITGLDKREFLLYTVSGQPKLFTTRWTMSYLAGPLNRRQLMRLSERAQVPTCMSCKVALNARADARFCGDACRMRHRRSQKIA